MGITMLKMDRAKAKWKVKLQNAFEGKRKYCHLYQATRVLILLTRR